MATENYGWQGLHVLDFRAEPVDVFYEDFNHGGGTVLAALQLFHARGDVLVGGADHDRSAPHLL